MVRDQLRHLSAENSSLASGLARKKSYCLALKPCSRSHSCISEHCSQSIFTDQSISMLALAACCLCCTHLGRDGFLSPAHHQVWELAALGQPVSRRCILTAHVPVWPQSKLPHAVWGGTVRTFTMNAASLSKARTC